MARWVVHARLDGMEAFEQIAAVAIACGAAVLFALMAWVGQHRS